jgi:hypothetical protein
MSRIVRCIIRLRPTVSYLTHSATVTGMSVIRHQTNRQLEAVGCIYRSRKSTSNCSSKSSQSCKDTSHHLNHSYFVLATSTPFSETTSAPDFVPNASTYPGRTLHPHINTAIPRPSLPNADPIPTTHLYPPPILRPIHHTPQTILSALSGALPIPQPHRDRQSLFIPRRPS